MDTRTDRSVDELQIAAATRRLMEVLTLDYRRSIKHLELQGRSQAEVARALGLKQPSLSSALKVARTVPDVVEGFSGAGPYEICQRYGVGQISREQLIDELTRWEYTSIPEPEWMDDITPSPEPGSFHEVMRAADEGLIDDELYDELQRRRFPDAE